MAASQLDKFKYLARKWVGQIGAGGVANNSVTTIPLSSATNLPTATGVTVVIDRVGATGAKTPTLEETLTGVVSGSNIISAIRGVEGTAQAHSAGAVVEVLVTAADWQSVMDGILVEHAQDGTHAATIIKTTGTQSLASKTLTTPVIASFYQDAGLTKLMTTPNTASDTLTAIAATQTLTNKRKTPRVYTTTSIAGAPGVLTPEIATYDNFEITAQAAPLNIANHSTSTPTQGETMVIAITSDATPRALTYGTAYVAKAGTALPSTTVASKTTTLGFMWNAGLGKWNLLAAGQEA